MAASVSVTRVILTGTILLASTGCALKASPKTDANAVSEASHVNLIQRAEVWRPTPVASMNIRMGPDGPGAFAPQANVECTFVSKDLSGATPKFACKLPDGSDVKVKYGRDNGEVYAEVAGTRLLWALGFGADAMYPVTVVCHGCPDPDKDDAGASSKGPVATRRYEYAAIERKLPGREIEGPDGPGWKWSELDTPSPTLDATAVASRDALRLLAAMLQHSDSKREQQRLLCLDASPNPDLSVCMTPFVMINDLGRTFGKASLFNRDKPSSVNLKAWSEAPVWEDNVGCKAHLSRSLTGTLDNPVITEEGRQFLASRLMLITDQQIYDLFDVSRFAVRSAESAASHADVQPWVDAFKQKVQQISSRSCAGARSGE